MADARNPRRILYALVVLLAIAAVAVTFVKVKYFGFSLSDSGAFFYQVDGSITLEPQGNVPVRISLAIPEPDDGWAFVPDDGDRSGFQLRRLDGFPRLVLTLEPPVTQRRVSFRYRLVPAPQRRPELPEKTVLPEKPPVADSVRSAAESILDRIDPERKLTTAELVPALLHELSALPPAEKRLLAPDAGSDMTVEAAITVLAVRGIPARILRGILYDQRRYQQQPSVYLDVWYNEAWHVYRPGTGTLEEPGTFLVLQRNDNSLLEVTGARNSSILFSVTRVPAGVERLNRIRAKIIDDRALTELSLFSLPASEQNLFKRLALLPLAILLIVVARNIVGITTMGTFMPVLIALAFLETGLLTGLIAFLLILSVGLGARALLTNMNLLMVPRISAVVVIVILLMKVISVLSYAFGFTQGQSITFFPLIILAWTIERASMVWEEDGAGTMFRQLAVSLAACIPCYFILNNDYLQYLFFTFQEFNLVILALILLLGTYTGYRLTELKRFQPLVNSCSDRS